MNSYSTSGQGAEAKGVKRFWEEDGRIYDEEGTMVPYQRRRRVLGTYPHPKFSL